MHVLVLPSFLILQEPYSASSVCFSRSVIMWKVGLLFLNHKCASVFCPSVNIISVTSQEAWERFEKIALKANQHLKAQFLHHRKHTAYPLQRSVCECYLGKYLFFILRIKLLVYYENQMKHINTLFRKNAGFLNV